MNRQMVLRDIEKLVEHDYVFGEWDANGWFCVYTSNTGTNLQYAQQLDLNPVTIPDEYRDMMFDLRDPATVDLIVILVTL